MKDVTYFENKNQKLQLACSQWLDLLSINWKASQIGPQLAESLFEDSTGAKAFGILEACFGVKSPSTLLKRASAFRNYVKWFDTSGYGNMSGCDPFPLKEVDIWEYFLWLRQNIFSGECEICQICRWPERGRRSPGGKAAHWICSSGEEDEGPDSPSTRLGS